MEGGDPRLKSRVHTLRVGTLYFQTSKQRVNHNLLETNLWTQKHTEAVSHTTKDDVVINEGTLRSALRQQLLLRVTNNTVRYLSYVTNDFLTNPSNGYRTPLRPLRSATTSTWFPNRSFSTASSDNTTTTKTKEEEEEQPSSIEFQAKTRELLDIVTNSLYTDKEVFLRELVSNASDALEKLRHAQQSQSTPPIDPDVPLEIHVETDEVNGTLTVRDTGVGLEREEMVSCLGTITRSGSRAFVSEMG